MASTNRRGGWPTCCRFRDRGGPLQMWPAVIGCRRIGSRSGSRCLITPAAPTPLSGPPQQWPGRGWCGSPASRAVWRFPGDHRRGPVSHGPSCAPSRDHSRPRAWSADELHDLPRFPAHRELYRPAPPGDRTRPDQVNDRPPLSMYEVVRLTTELLSAPCRSAGRGCSLAIPTGGLPCGLLFSYQPVDRRRLAPRHCGLTTGYR